MSAGEGKTKQLTSKRVKNMLATWLEQRGSRPSALFHLRRFFKITTCLGYLIRENSWCLYADRCLSGSFKGKSLKQGLQLATDPYATQGYRRCMGLHCHISLRSMELCNYCSTIEACESCFLKIAREKLALFLTAWSLGPWSVLFSWDLIANVLFTH